MLVPYDIDNIKKNVICHVICLSFPFCRKIFNGIFFLRHLVYKRTKGQNMSAKDDTCLLLLKGRNVPATALRWFASDTTHIAFIHITFAVKSVHIFLASSRVSKSCLMSELLFPSFCAF